MDSVSEMSSRSTPPTASDSVTITPIAPITPTTDATTTAKSPVASAPSTAAEVTTNGVNYASNGTSNPIYSEASQPVSSGMNGIVGAESRNGSAIEKIVVSGNGVSAPAPPARSGWRQVGNP